MALAEAGLFLGDSQTETEIMQELNLNWSNANDKHLAKRTVESWFMDAGSSSLKFARRQFCSCSHCWTTAGVESGVGEKMDQTCSCLLVSVTVGIVCAI